MTEETVTTPDLRGHPPLVVGGRASVEGRYVYADDGSLQRTAQRRPRTAPNGE